MNDLKVPKELVKMHYMQIVASIIQRSAQNQTPISTLVRQFVYMFGFVPTLADPLQYELIPKIRAKVDEESERLRALVPNVPALPQTFTEDEAILFCACQTAMLDATGQLDALGQKLSDEVEKLEREHAAKLGAAPQEQPQNIIQFPQGDQVVPKKNGPTFH